MQESFPIRGNQLTRANTEAVSPEWEEAISKGLDVSPEATKRRADEMFPRVMYKGVTSVFDEIDLGRQSTSAGAPFDSKGYTFVTSDPAVAEWYALLPLRDPLLYMRTLIRKSHTPQPAPPHLRSKKMILDFLTHHPDVYRAYTNMEAVLQKHSLSKETSWGRWFRERNLRNEVLEAAEAVAHAFNTAVGTTIEIRPSIMPLRVNDEGFLARNGGDMPMEHTFNVDMLEDALAKAVRMGKGGVTVYNVQDGSPISSNVMAIRDESRIRSAHAVFDPDHKHEAGLLK